jgi:hypothetical protein
LEADFARVYGLDLGAAVWGPHRIGPRRLLVLIRHLPMDAALLQTTSGTWGWLEEGMASLLEMTAHTHRILVQGFSHGRSKGGKRLRIPRPKRFVDLHRQPVRAKRAATFEEVMSIFSGGPN